MVRGSLLDVDQWRHFFDDSCRFDQSPLMLVIDKGHFRARPSPMSLLFWASFPSNLVLGETVALLIPQCNGFPRTGGVTLTEKGNWRKGI